MLDEDEMVAYLAWKEHKLTTHPDLSVAAYNAEMGAMANAWDEGVDAMSAGFIIRQNKDDVKRENPYRQPGMRGHVPHAATNVSGNITINNYTPEPIGPVSSTD